MPQSSRNTLHRTTLMPVRVGGGLEVMCVSSTAWCVPLTRCVVEPVSPTVGVFTTTVYA